MLPDRFWQDLNQFRNRLEKLYQEAIAPTHSELAHLLSKAYKELSLASEEIMVASEEILLQSQQVKMLQNQLNRERRLLDTRFNNQSDNSLVTDERGSVLQANPGVAYLFNIKQHYLLDKPVDLFLTPQYRLQFPWMMQKLVENRQTYRWRVTIKPRHCQPLAVLLRATPALDNPTIRWTFSYLFSADSTNLSDQNVQHYERGEIIPLLKPEFLWVVRAGIVKLSTTSETGEDVLLGLVGPEMPFGASMTALSIYQATALSESVALVPLSLIKNELALEHLRTQVFQRLQQTETLLAISGKRHAQERLNYLLQWLKDNFGQPCAQGTRLTIRLTHQDLADACCTARATISRLMSKLKQKQQLAYDSESHILFLN